MYVHTIDSISFSRLFTLVNIGQNGPGNNNTPTQQTAPSQTSTTNATQQTTAIPAAVNLPGVAAGNLDFSNLARSLGTMVQGLTGRLIPGATLVNPNQATGTTPANNTSSTTPSSQSSTSNSTSTTRTTNNDNDTVTEQMFGGMISTFVRICLLRFDFFSRCCRTYTSVGRWY